MFKIGIIGAGWIAQKMAKTLAPLQDYCVHAVASRSREKAEAFAKTWNITKAYGSYEELVCDEDIDLVPMPAGENYIKQHYREAAILS